MLSTPFELRFLLARRVDVFNRLLRVFGEEVMRFQRAQARQVGIPSAVSAGVSFPQRFGSALNLNTHVHAVFCDGIFTIDTAGSRFHPLPAPSSEALEKLCMRVHDRLRRWLAKRGLLAEATDLDSNEAPEPSAIDACTTASLGLGALVHVPADGTEDGGAEEPEPLRTSKRARGRHLGQALGFSVHAGVTARDARGRELLLRYCARPALALGRLSELPDGRIAYRLKKPWRADQTHVVFTPVEFLARAAALIPPPRSPLIRFHGAFAAHHAGRGRVVAARKGKQAARPSACALRGQAPPRTDAPLETVQGTKQQPKTSQRGSVPRALSAAPTTTRSTELDAERIFATAPWRIDWATLLRRVHDVDALQCPGCGGRLRFIELVTERVEAARWLARMGLDAEPPAALPHRLVDEVDFLPPNWDP